MKTLLTLCVLTASAFAQDVVFRGTPTLRVLTTIEGDVRQQLDQAAGYKNECVIIQRGKKYLWASRDNAEMLRFDDKQFTYFILKGGGGYVKVFTGVRDENAPADYVENVSVQGFPVMTYWGKVNRP